MDYHHHARLTIYSREQLAKSVVQGRLSLCEAAAEHGLSRQTAAKWVRRHGRADSRWRSECWGRRRILASRGLRHRRSIRVPLSFRGRWFWLGRRG